MKGWPALFHQAAQKIMAELERLDPANTTLAFARSIFTEGPPPSGRPPGGKSQEARERRAERDAKDREAAAIYATGLSIVATGERIGRSQTYVAAALRRQGVKLRPPGPSRGKGVDLERLERIRAMRAENPPRSLEEIGAEFRISRERVRQICAAHGIDHSAPEELTDVQLAAVHDYLRGSSLEVVAVKYGIGPHALRNWILRAGHVPRERATKAREFSPRTRHRANVAAKLYRQGLKTRDIANRLGLPKPEMVYRLLAIGGVQPDRKPRQLQ